MAPTLAGTISRNSLGPYGTFHWAQEVSRPWGFLQCRASRLPVISLDQAADGGEPSAAFGHSPGDGLEADPLWETRHTIRVRGIREGRHQSMPWAPHGHPG